MVPHLPAFCRFPLALCAAAFASGIYLDTTLHPGLVFYIGLAIVILIIVVISTVKRFNLVATHAVLLAFVSMGVLFSSVETKSVSDTRLKRMFERGEMTSGEPFEVTGVLERAPEIAPDAPRLGMNGLSPKTNVETTCDTEAINPVRR